MLNVNPQIWPNFKTLNHFFVIKLWAGLLASRYLQNSESSAGFQLMAASDWSIVIISTLPFPLTGSRGEYFRVVGIILMVEKRGRYL